MSLPPLRQIITADTGPLDQALGRATSRLRQFAGPAAIGAVVAGLTALTRASMRSVDELAKQARSLGIATDRLQAMALVAQEAGVSQGQLTTALGRMQQAITQAQDGLAGATRAFDRLGIASRDLEGLAPDEQFRRIAEGLNSIADPAQRTTAAMEIFGRAGRDLTNMLADYGVKLDEAAEFQRRFGIAVSDEQAAAIERANDAIGRLGMAFQGLGNTLAVTFAPAIEGAANMIGRLAGAIMERAQPAQEDFLESIARTPTATEIANSALGGYNDHLAATEAAARQAADAIDRLNRAMANTPDLPVGLLSGVGPGLTSGQRGDIESFLNDPDNFGATDLPEAVIRSLPARARQAPPRAPAMLGEPVPAIGGGGAVSDQMAQRLQALVDGLQTEREIINGWYADSLQVLIDARERGLLTEEDFMQQRERLEEEHQRRLASIREAGEQASMAGTKSLMEGMLSVTQSGGKRMIAAQKAISATLALINTWEGVSKALTLPWPQNFRVAAQTLAQGMAAVSNIRGAGNGGGGGAALGGAAMQAPRQNIIIDLVGDTFSRGSVESLFAEINEGLRSGYQIDGVMVR